MAATGVPHAWFVQLYSGICGATTIIFAWAALRPALTGIRGRTQAAMLLTITFGAGFLSDAFFRIDCRTADGCTAEQKIQTWHAVIHASSLLVSAAWIILLAAWILRLGVAANGPAHDGAPDRSRD